MLTRRFQRTAAWAAMLTAGVVVMGCRVDEHKNGGNENVKISTPFGGLSVKTDGAGVQNGVGLDVYPGSTPEKKEKGHDGAADVNLNFGSFHLGVKAVSYTTPDSPDQVLAFYRKVLARYGTVIECGNHRPLGTPTRTADGLGCEEEGNHHIQINDDDDDRSKKQLKAGSRQHQHVVEIETKGTGTKYGLIMLDLPGKLGDDEGDKQ